MPVVDTSAFNAGFEQVRNVWSVIIYFIQWVGRTKILDKLDTDGHGSWVLPVKLQSPIYFGRAWAAMESRAKRIAILMGKRAEATPRLRPWRQIFFAYSGIVW